jgi:hypothetical protein
MSSCVVTFSVFIIIFPTLYCKEYCVLVMSSLNGVKLQPMRDWTLNTKDVSASSRAVVTLHVQLIIVLEILYNYI